MGLFKKKVAVMNYKSLKKLLNQIVIVGQTKKTLFRKSKPFEMQIFFTPIKNKIVIIHIEGIEQNRLDINFVTGDDISKVLTWVEQNRYTITFQRNRF